MAAGVGVKGGGFVSVLRRFAGVSGAAEMLSFDESRVVDREALLLITPFGVVL